jgi:hypothetical protein
MEMSEEPSYADYILGVHLSLVCPVFLWKLQAFGEKSHEHPSK